MRTRNNQIVFCLNDKEHKRFTKQVEKSGLTKAAFLRRIIKGHTVRERLPKDYAKLVYEVAKIGNNVNQLAHKANRTNYVAVEDAQTAVLLMEKLWEQVRGIQ